MKIALSIKVSGEIPHLPDFDGSRFTGRRNGKCQDGNLIIIVIQAHRLRELEQDSPSAPKVQFAASQLPG